MARNGSGTYTLPAGNPVVTGTTISSTTHNTTMSDLESEMTNSTDKDGQTVITGAWDYNGNKIILDVDADTSITADTDDLIDIEIEGVDAIKLGYQKIADGSFVDIDPKAVTLDASESFHRTLIASSNAITVPAGTTTTVSSLRVNEPNITATGTLTNSATLYISGAASEATNNWAIWVDAGECQFDAKINCSDDIVMASGKGLDFSATADGTTKSSEVFDDYEEGTFTPALGDTSRSDSESQTYSTQFGRYIKVGRVVYFHFDMTLTSIGTLTTSEPAYLLGLPFTASSDNDPIGAITMAHGANLNLGTATGVTGWVNSGQADAIFKIWEATAGPNNLLVSEVSADGRIAGSGFYQV